MSNGPPRSQRLLAYTFPGSGYSPTFTCPPNAIVLLKHASFLNAGVAATGVYLMVSTPQNIQVLPVYGDVSPSAGLTWEGWLVLNPGDYMAAHAAAAGVTAWVSGAVLLGTPAFPPAELASPLQFPPPGTPVYLVQ